MFEKLPTPREFYNYATKHKYGSVIRTSAGLQEFINDDEFSNQVIEQLRNHDALPPNIAEEKHAVGTWRLEDFEKEETIAYLKGIRPYMNNKIRKYKLLPLLYKWICCAYKQKRKASKMERIKDIIQDDNKTNFDKLAEINRLLEDHSE
jgi:hypothetical protein